MLYLEFVHLSQIRQARQPLCATVGPPSSASATCQAHDSSWFQNDLRYLAVTLGFDTARRLLSEVQFSQWANDLFRNVQLLKMCSPVFCLFACWKRFRFVVPLSRWQATFSWTLSARTSPLNAGGVWTFWNRRGFWWRFVAQWHFECLALSLECLALICWGTGTSSGAERTLVLPASTGPSLQIWPLQDALTLEVALQTRCTFSACNTDSNGIRSACCHAVLTFMQLGRGLMLGDWGLNKHGWNDWSQWERDEYQGIPWTPVGSLDNVWCVLCGCLRMVWSWLKSWACRMD